MNKETFKKILRNKIKESTEIKKDRDQDTVFDKDIEKDKEDDKKHPNKRSEKEKRNVVMFFKELSEDIFTEGLENDKEGQMARNQASTIARYSIMLRSLIEEDTDLPEWLEKKLTIAEENIITCYNYLMNERD